MARDRGQVDRRVGRSADRRIDADRVVECLFRQDIGRLEVLRHHCDDTLAGEVRDLLPVAIRRGNRRRSGQAHAQRLAQRIHRRRRAHRVAIAGRRRRAGDQADELGIVDLARRQHLPRLPHDRSRSGALALVPAVQHRPHGQSDRRDVHRRRAHQHGGRRLVAADRQHHAVERIAVQRFDQAEIGEVAVQPRGRALAGFLDRMDREFQHDAARLAHALAHPLRQHQMVAVARGQVAARLRDADDRLARAQLVQAEAEVQIALQIQRRHVDIVRIVEPGAGPQGAGAFGRVGGHKSSGQRATETR